MISLYLEARGVWKLREGQRQRWSVCWLVEIWNFISVRMVLGWSGWCQDGVGYDNGGGGGVAVTTAIKMRRWARHARWLWCKAPKNVKSHISCLLKMTDVKLFKDTCLGETEGWCSWKSWSPFAHLWCWQTHRRSSWKGCHRENPAKWRLLVNSREKDKLGPADGLSEGGSAGAGEE